MTRSVAKGASEDGPDIAEIIKGADWKKGEK